VHYWNLKNFESGQKVRHSKVAQVMEVVGRPGLAAIATSSGYTSASVSSEAKIICKYMKNGKTVQKSFKLTELTAV
jgi:hypothetical protein